MTNDPELDEAREIWGEAHPVPQVCAEFEAELAKWKATQADKPKRKPRPKYDAKRRVPRFLADPADRKVWGWKGPK